MIEPIDLSGGEIAIAPPLEPLAALGARFAEIGTGYAPREGNPELRALLHERLGLSADQAVILTTGASLGLSATLRVLADPGDPILMPACGYPGFTAMAHMLGLRIVHYPLDGALDAGLAPVRCAVLNSPHNPTGATVGPERLVQVLNFCRAQRCTLILDEVYADFDAGHDALVAILSSTVVPVIRVGSLSKGLALAGWRLGYVVADCETAARVSRAHFALAMSASAPAQAAALAMFKWAGLTAWREMLSSRLDLRRAQASESLSAAGFDVRGGATPFFWVGCHPALGNSARFAALALHAGVGVAAGAQFEGEASTRFRINMAAAPGDAFEEALDRLCRLHLAARRKAA